jgi:formamidopyrimidine-DNA glycosylase
MPELPEVETVRRGLAPRLVGVRLESVWTSGKPLRMNHPLDLRGLERTLGEVAAVERVAKYLIIRVAERSLVVHLGMTGRLEIVPRAAEREPHTHVVWSLSSGKDLRYMDVRRFGAVLCAADPAELPEIEVLGDDPLSRGFTAARLAELAHGRKKNAKTFLLDQSRVAGLGNIYVCEALHLAGIHPEARVDRLKLPKIAALHAAIQGVLRKAVQNRGTTLRDYRDSSGRPGENQLTLQAYGREGQPCPRGDGRIRRVVIQGRSTFFCPACQRRS